MKPQLDHLIVWSADRHAAAAFVAGVFGIDPPTEFGQFTQVETEIATRPYGSGPVAEQHSRAR